MAKVCTECNNSFYPTGKTGKICELCKAKRFSIRIANMNNEIGLRRIDTLITKKIEQGAPKSELTISQL